jgi:hypothetical protein
MTARRALAVLATACAAATFAGCGASRTSLVAQPPPASLSAAPLRPPITPTSAYRAQVEARIAHDLHVSLRSIRSQLRAAPGSTLVSLAKPLGLAQDQLGAIVLTSLDHAVDAAVGSGRWTPAGARKEKRYWMAQSAPSLIAEISRWLVNG